MVMFPGKQKKIKQHYASGSKNELPGRRHVRCTRQKKFAEPRLTQTLEPGKDENIGEILKRALSYGGGLHIPRQTRRDATIY